MGILYEKVKVTQEMKKQFFISRLLERGITETKDGTSIYALDYYALRHEAVISDYRNKHIENSENAWF